MIASSGGTGVPATSSVGAQYAAVSAGRWHVVRAARSVASVDDALVETLPTKLWSCEIPGRFG